MIMRIGHGFVSEGARGQYHYIEELLPAAHAAACLARSVRASLCIPAARAQRVLYCPVLSVLALLIPVDKPALPRFAPKATQRATATRTIGQCSRVVLLSPRLLHELFELLHVLFLPVLHLPISLSKLDELTCAGVPKQREQWGDPLSERVQMQKREGSRA
jgi:hypothetical protein